MTEIRIDAARASNKQLRREVERLQQENANLRGQISYINARLLQKFSKKKIEKIFAPPKVKKEKALKKVGKAEKELKELKAEVVERQGRREPSIAGEKREGGVLK
ncbi:MAG: hypothetical protein JW984_15190 [Deltaproteobacteria bacterium]|uniref:Uncharacterized protein n=1 Tax=Candidatus Zymogenus saltonus TaxID=2844893 RepID=A0A9D8KGC6_9DELT|nr:hypothetical protein [Candidatus Zymogenus saltonus]